MKKTTIEKIYSYKKTMLHVQITLLCCVILVLVFIGRSSFYAFFPLFLVMGFSFLQQCDLFFRLREVYRFFQKDHQTETEILWWNYDDFFLTDDKIIIVSSKVDVFPYSDIKSIQKERYHKKDNQYPITEFYLHINLKDETHYKIAMYSFYGDIVRPYDSIEDATDLLLERNPNIVVEKTI